MSDQGKSSQALTKYFEEHFRPDNSLTASNTKRYRTAIRSFYRFTGRTVRMGEITDIMMSRFTRWCRQQGVLPATANYYATAITTLVGDAIPQKFVKGSARLSTLANRFPLRKNSLKVHFENVLRPQRFGKLSRSQLAPFRAALNKLTLFCERDVTIGELTPKLLTAYRAWLVERGLLPRSIRRDCLRLVQLRYLAAPESFDKVQGEWPQRWEHPKCRVKAAEWEPTIKPTDAPDGSLMHFLHHVYVPSRLDIKTSSVEQLDAMVRVFDRWHGGSILLSELSDDLVVKFMRASREEGLSPWTVNSRRRSILTLWKFAYKKRYLDELWRDIPRMKQPRRLPDAWTIRELEKLIAATDTLAGDLPNGIKKSRFWRALILLTYDTGIRRGDILTIRTDNLRDGQLAVMVEKTGVEILRPLAPETIAAIKATYPPERELIFDWPHCREYLDNHWHKIKRAAGLPDGPGQGLHKLRRTSASHLESVAPGTAGRHLGHLTPGLAERHYIDPRIAKPQNAAALLPRPMLSKGGAA